MRMPYIIGDKIFKEREGCSWFDPVDDLVLVWRDACGLLVLLLSRVCITVTLSDPWTTVGIFCGSFYDFILKLVAGFYYGYVYPWWESTLNNRTFMQDYYFILSRYIMKWQILYISDKWLISLLPNLTDLYIFTILIIIIFIFNS